MKMLATKMLALCLVACLHKRNAFGAGENTNQELINQRSEYDIEAKPSALELNLNVGPVEEVEDNELPEDHSEQLAAKGSKKLKKKGRVTKPRRNETTTTRSTSTTKTQTTKSPEQTTTTEVRIRLGVRRVKTGSTVGVVDSGHSSGHAMTATLVTFLTVVFRILG